MLRRNLDRNIGPQPWVARLPHLAHADLARGRDDFVRIGLGAGSQSMVKAGSLNPLYRFQPDLGSASPESSPREVNFGGSRADGARKTRYAELDRAPRQILPRGDG